MLAPFTIRQNVPGSILMSVAHSLRQLAIAARGSKLLAYSSAEQSGRECQVMRRRCQTTCLVGGIYVYDDGPCNIFLPFRRKFSYIIIAYIL